jgi:hypothetical protein
MTNVLKGLTLELLYKLGAGWITLWVLMLWFAPNMFFEMGGVEPTDDLRVMARYLGLAMAAIAGFHWIIPMWSGDDIKKFAQVTAAPVGGFPPDERLRPLCGNNA